jgi:hypothetical protein|tara:strand:- start:87 stop:287 length:201 start_codon:yes stop_codon:yes gene_type:complete
MNKYTAEIGVLEHIWEKRTVETIAENEKEAKEKIKEHEYFVISRKMGEVEWTNQDLHIESIEEKTK